MSGFLCLMLGAFPSEITDPYFKDTVLLIHGDGTNGAQNNTFLDSSSNNFSITRNGNATQGTFSPFSKEEGKWGVAFDGSGDQLYTTASAAFLFPDDFTIEFFVFLNSGSGTQHLYGTGSAGEQDQCNVTSGTVGYGTAGNVGVYGPSGALTAGAWHHVAITRASGTNRVFVDGVSGSTVSATGNAGSSSRGPYIGLRFDNNNPLNGYISNLRVVKGTALYTSNFTPSTSPLANITNTSLLCCQSNRFKDNGTANGGVGFTLTTNGNVSVTPFSPFANSAAYSAAANGGSGYFDGTVDYLTLPPSAGALGTGDFTIECFYKSNTIGVGTNNAAIAHLPSASTGAWAMKVNEGGSQVLAFAYNNSGWANIQSTANPNDGAWHHLAITRAGTAISLYMDGNRVGTGTLNGAISFGVAASETRIASSQVDSNYTNCHISNARVSQSVLYSGTTYTVPTSPFSQSGLFLLNFTNAAIYDQTGTCDLETVGNAQISTSVKKYGTGSMSFDGSGDGIQFGPSDSLVLGTGNFTIEFWLYMNAQTGTYDSLVDTRWSSGTGFVINSYNNSINYYNGSYQLSRPRSLNTWHHVALVRSNGVSKLYVDGDAGASTYSDAGNYNTTVWQIGRYYGPSDYLNGYIDDLRISKYARYTANFTPPTGPFADR